MNYLCMIIVFCIPFFFYPLNYLIVNKIVIENRLVSVTGKMKLGQKLTNKQEMK